MRISWPFLLAATLAAAQATPDPATPPVSAPAESVHVIDTLSAEWAAREDSLRLAADTASPQAAPADTGEAASGPVAPGTASGNGSLSGRVVSEMSGTVIAKARVILAGQERSVETDVDGNFAFPDLVPGAYSLLLTHGSYDPLSVDSLPVAPGRGIFKRLRMPDKVSQRDRVRITFKAAKASDAGLLFAQKNAPGVSDGISTEQMSKSPDGDAAAAVRRVSGISIAGDGQVYVRGLGERYVNVQLNGLTLSSPNFEKRVIPLDIFPTRLIENLVVSKSFTADQPAEFAGGALQLRTKDYPDRRILEVSVSGTYEPGSTFGDMLTYKGGSLDALGMDDGRRELPGGVPNEYFDHRTRNMGDTQAERQLRQRRMIASLANVWTPTRTTAPPGQGYGLTLGNKIPLGEDKVFGWLLGGSYSGKWGLDDEYSARVGMTRDQADTSVRRAIFADQVSNQVSTEGVLWGILGTATLQLGGNQKYRFNFMANRDWEDEVSRTYGRRESDADTTLVFEMRNANQTLNNGQIEGEHRTDLVEGLKLDWMAALTRARRWEPDRRVSQYFKADTANPVYDPAFPYSMGSTLGLWDRYWYNLAETGGGGKADVEAPAEWAFLDEGSKLKAGAFYFSKARDYEVRRLTFAAGSQIPVGHPLRSGRYETMWDALNGAADTGYIHSRNDKQKDDYEVEDDQWALHAQADMVLPAGFRAITGVRFIRAQVAAKARSPRGELNPPEIPLATCGAAGACVLPFGYEETALLPALSLVYSLSDRQNLRGSWTRTFSFPEYREMAPVLFFSYQEALETVGNPNLEPTDIYNYDLRWEWFPAPGEMLALSGFYKDFSEPVETLIEQGSSNNRAQFVNVPSAWLYGLEAELRFGLERFADILSPFKVVTNYTWIQSEVDGARKRPMQGQSPYLVNVILFFEPFGGSTQMSLLFNRFGERISKVGVQNFPDVVERPRSSLELSVSQKLPGGLKSKFTAKNLTDAEAIHTQGGLVTKRVSPGKTYSLGISYAF